MANSTPTPAAIASAEKAVTIRYNHLDRLLHKVMREKKVVNRIKRRFPRVKAPTIPLHIYKNGKKENKDHILTKLPAEVQRMIFKALPSNADRAALGLTCKVQAEVYESLKEERSRKDFAQRPPVRVTRVHRLQMLVRLIPDMPRRYRLCYNCNQFIDLDDSDNNGQWGGSASFVKGGLATPAAMKKGPRCPLCVEADKLELAEHKPMFRKFLCLADSIQHCNEWQQAMD